eukprot:TRINITY_DN26972_c0_g1_i1.p1 TRINITY_DN26972_c0_g1~~TRINITY_DN26972_c0_g1_i1.p1  ORF type:complete len:123 (+),score=8.54 TRINITY_DN26972_c0_g1_i1:1-369(+)
MDSVSLGLASPSGTSHCRVPFNDHGSSVVIECFCRYFIVDINYMPGYERIPGFPELFVNFVKQCVAAHRETQGLPSAVAVAAGSDSVQGLPAQPYQVLPAKKKWAVLSAAMKFCGARGKPVA